MYCGNKVLGLNTTLNQTCCPLRNYYSLYYKNRHCFELCSEIPIHVVKSQQSETSNFGLHFTFL